MTNRTNDLDTGAPNESGTDWDRLRTMTTAEADAAAKNDPDALPLAPGRKLKKFACTKMLRNRLGLSQTSFAERYRIPLALTEAWEQYSAEPDEMAVAYLAAISADAEGVARAVDTALKSAAE